MVHWYIQTEVEHYEAFRPTLDEIIEAEKLKDWLDERLQHDAIWEGNGVPMRPPILPPELTRFHHEPEPALSAVWYFMLTNGDHAERILAEGIALTRELETNQNKVRDLAYVNVLEKLFFDVVPPREEDVQSLYFRAYSQWIETFGKTLMDVLMSKGTPEKPASDYFGEDVEEKMLEIVKDSGYYEKMSDKTKEDVTAWLQNYVRKRTDAVTGLQILAVVDYECALASVSEHLTNMEIATPYDKDSDPEVQQTIKKIYYNIIACSLMSHPDGPEAAAQAWRRAFDSTTYTLLGDAARQMTFDNPESTVYQTQFLAALEQCR